MGVLFLKRRKLFQNAMILTATSFILRTFGMLVRSYLARKMGEEGMGLYQLIISIYVLATTIVTSGISTAVTRLITESQARGEDKALAKQMMKKSIKVAIVLSSITMIVFYHLAEPISILWLHEKRAISAIRLLLIVLPFVSISSCLKSYFIACRKVVANSISQLLEQLVRIGLIFFLFGCRVLRRWVF